MQTTELSKRTQYEVDKALALAAIRAHPLYVQADDSIFITGLKHGQVCPATSAVASEHLALNKHRISTVEEVDRYTADFIARTEASKRQQVFERRSAPLPVANLKSALAELLAMKEGKV